MAHEGGMFVVKRDGREEKVQLDKITARISKLTDGLDMRFIDPVSILYLLTQMNYFFGTAVSEFFIPLFYLYYTIFHSYISLFMKEEDIIKYKYLFEVHYIVRIVIKIITT